MMHITCIVRIYLQYCSIDHRIFKLRQIDLEDIKDAFKKMYKKSLADAVKDETKRDYRKLLLAIIK